MKQLLLLLAIIGVAGCGSKQSYNATEKERWQKYWDSVEAINTDEKGDSLAYHRSAPIVITPYNIDSFARLGMIKGDYEISEWIDSDGWKKRIVTFKKKTDTFTPPKRPKLSYFDIYPNFSDKRDVKFSVSKNYQTGCYDILWQLWIDGDIAMSDFKMDVSPSGIEKYKSKIRRHCNNQIPELLQVWSKH